MILTEHHCGLLLSVTRATIRSALGDTAPPPQLDPLHLSDPALVQPAGCFVSLHELHTHRLRGCVGRLEATAPLLEGVRASARNVLSDPRFARDRVRLDELPGLEVELSVLSPLRPAAEPLAFDLLSDGIYLTVGKRSGCFLPQVARQTGWTREQLLDRLCAEKLGLPARAWHDKRARLFVFSTLLVGPEPFEEGLAAHSAVTEVPLPQ